MEPAGHLSDKLAGQMKFGCAGQALRAMGIHQQETVVVLTESCRTDVTHQQGHAFFDAFGFGMGLQVMTFSSKAHAKKHAAAGTGRGGHLRQNVWVLYKIE